MTQQALEGKKKVHAENSDTVASLPFLYQLFKTFLVDSGKDQRLAHPTGKYTKLYNIDTALPVSQILASFGKVR